MGTFRLTKAERRLFKCVQDGGQLRLQDGEQIRASVLRRIVLGLPLTKPGGVDCVCCRTAVGISICGGMIRGRLILDSAVGEEGGPTCPLMFERTRFRGGFSGRHGRFSGLGFRDCWFRDSPAPPDGEMPDASIDLSGAEVGSELNMEGCRPYRDTLSEAEADDDYFGDQRIESGANHFWVRLVDARIDGRLNLSRARLRVPEEPEGRRLEQDGIEAVALSLLELAGDLLFIGGRTRGRILARRAHIRGDIWMVAARLNGVGRQALVFQSATVEGFVIINGERVAGEAGPAFRRFCARGEINFHGARLGRKLRIGNADLYPSVDLPADDARVRGAAAAEDEAPRTCLCLEGAHVDGGVYISANQHHPSHLLGQVQLNYLEVKNEIRIQNCRFGLAPGAKAGIATIQAKSLAVNDFCIDAVDSISSAHTLSMDLEGAHVGSLKITESLFNGAVCAPSLQCRRDVVLWAQIDGGVSLAGATIGGSLDISRLRITDADAELNLKDGSIGRALRLASHPLGNTSGKADAGAAGAPAPGEKFKLKGSADLTGLSCEEIDDEVGRCWGRARQIKMNHFTYGRTGSLPRKKGRGKGSSRIVGDWILRRRMEGLLPLRWVPRNWLPPGDDFWNQWQLRRNWIYQQFEKAPPQLNLLARHRIRADEYRPQPFEQAIKVARAEGREDFATYFEIQKQRVEWRFVNRGLRWALAFVGIVLSSLWLFSHAPSDRAGWLAFAALAVTLALMVSGSAIRNRICRPLVGFVHESRYAWLGVLAVEIVLLALWRSHSGKVAWFFGFLAVSVVAILLAILGAWVVMLFLRPTTRSRGLSEKDEKKENEWVEDESSKVVTWLIYWIPAILLLGLTDWYEKPFHYFVGFVIFAVIRLTGVAAHAVMRFGFGYLRRPIYAVTTLIAAFVVGWWGVHFANQRGMLVIDAQPVADLAMPDDHAAFPDGHRGAGSTPVLMGSRQVPGGEGYVRELPCGATISEALYALDVLIPIIDLREERSCEIRRVAEPADEREHSEGTPERAGDKSDPGKMSFGELWAAFPELALDNHRFWWWMKAIYAIFGWIFVSLAILTFAQAARTHAEPPTEKK